MTPQRKRRQRNRRPANIRSVAIRGIRHDPPDIRKLAKVIVSLATARQNEGAPHDDSFDTRESITAPDEQQNGHSEAV